MRGVKSVETGEMILDTLGVRAKNFDSIVGSHIINEEQEELVEIYSNALQRDLLKE